MRLIKNIEQEPRCELGGPENVYGLWYRYCKTCAVFHPDSRGNHDEAHAVGENVKASPARGHVKRPVLALVSGDVPIPRV